MEQNTKSQRAGIQSQIDALENKKSEITDNKVKSHYSLPKEDSGFVIRCGSFSMYFTPYFAENM